MVYINYLSLIPSTALAETSKKAFDELHMRSLNNWLGYYSKIEGTHSFVRMVALVEVPNSLNRQYGIKLQYSLWLCILT